MWSQQNVDFYFPDLATSDLNTNPNFVKLVAFDPATCPTHSCYQIDLNLCETTCESDVNCGGKVFLSSKESQTFQNREKDPPENFLKNLDVKYGSKLLPYFPVPW